MAWYNSFTETGQNCRLQRSQRVKNKEASYAWLDGKDIACKPK